MREIILDTETTGLSTKEGDRITEIGCIEVIDKKITGKSFHTYVNPERELSVGASEISGLSYDFLKNHKTFDKVADEFLEFLGKDRIVIHNVPFDMEFLNFEMDRLGKNAIKNYVIDTLVMAKQKFPGSPVNLDALCSRFSIDKSIRTKHGALIDANLLAQVYVIMSVDVTQRNIFSNKFMENEIETTFEGYIYKDITIPRDFSISAKELKLHKELLEKIKTPLWSRYIESAVK